jgi:hypothetical protein
MATLLSGLSAFAFLLETSLAQAPRAVLAGGLLSALLSCGGREARETFESDIAYDTVVVVGALDETNPLFVYGQPLATLLDDRTVAYSDLGSSGGRIVVADLISGEGWDIESTPGGDGPGEFGGRTPWLFPDDEVIYALDGPRLTTWSYRGELLGDRPSEPWPWLAAQTQYVPGGVVGGRIVMKYMETGDHQGPPEQVLRQGIRIYDLDGRTVRAITDGIPDLVQRLVPQSETAVRFTTISGDGLMVHARHETVVWILRYGQTVASLDAGGRVLARRRLDGEVIGAFVDADERVWATVASRDAEGGLGNIVMDRNLNELFRVAASGVQDASGNAILTLRAGEFDTIELVLLRMGGR